MQDKTSMWSRCYWSRLRLLRGGGKKRPKSTHAALVDFVFFPPFFLPTPETLWSWSNVYETCGRTEPGYVWFRVLLATWQRWGGEKNHCRRCLGVSTKMLVGILSDRANLVLAAQFPALWMCAVLFVAALALRKQNCWSLLNCLSWTK